MGFDSEQWIGELVGRLNDAFGDRVLFIGHTGSYARGEATEESDVDVNIVLDRLTMDDLDAYRHIIRSMPHRDKACGFICGKEEMKAWPAHELFQFTQGCKVLRGSLDGLVATPDEEDIADSIRNLASSVYHLCCHGYLFREEIDDAAEELKDGYKVAFFALQELVFLQEREYVPTKKELLGHLDAEDRRVVEVCMHWAELEDDRRDRPEHYFSLLKGWSSRMLKNVRKA